MVLLVLSRSFLGRNASREGFFWSRVACCIAQSGPAAERFKELGVKKPIFVARIQLIWLLFWKSCPREIGLNLTSYGCLLWDD